jgi:hypothetical protein
MMKKILCLLFALLCILLSILKLNAQGLLISELNTIPHSALKKDTSYIKVYVEKVDPENIQLPTEISSIATDRPDQTECPFLVPVKMFQIETGYSVEYDKDKSTKTKNYTYNTTLIKYGVSKQWEFRLIAEYLGAASSYKNGNDKTVNRVKGMNSLSVGTKIFICEERGIIPKTSLLAHLELPYFGSPMFKVKHLAPRFRFSMQHTITERISFSYNVGGEWDGNSQDATIIYTASLGMGLVRNLNMFVEAYGFMTENSNKQDAFSGSFTNDHRLDGGLTYLLKSNLQLDVSGGIGISKVSPDSFLSCGLSWRFPR